MQKIKKYTIITLAALSPFFGFVPRTLAEDIVVTGNGSESNNEVQVNQSHSTDVSQTNNADVSNDVSVTTSTGDNHANGNTNGDVNVQTGSAATSTDVTNALNTSSVQADPCCPMNTGTNGGQAVVSGNGSGSTNTISFTSSFTANAKVTNTAQITNAITGYVSTGNNRANDNSGGSVSITTGDIHVTENIVNKANVSFIKLGIPTTSDMLLKIHGNGTESDNTIDHDFTNAVVVAVNNHANIFNDTFWELITGDNSAKGNTDGDVAIQTGDIDFKSNISNEANKAVTIVACCQKKEEEKPIANVPPEKPSAPKPSEEKPSGPGGQGGPGGPGGNGGPSKGEVLGEAIGKTLPVTGNLWFFLALVGNLAMLMFGTYLRLRSGRSPGLAVA